MRFPIVDLPAYVNFRSFQAAKGAPKGEEWGMFSTFSMTAESVIKAAAEDLERGYSSTMHIRVQLLKDARVIAECPLTVDNECMTSYKRIIKMLVDNKLIRAEKAKMFTVEECPEGREAMIFLNIKREKIPVMIIAH